MHSGESRGASDTEQGAEPGWVPRSGRDAAGGGLGGVGEGEKSESALSQWWPRLDYSQEQSLGDAQSAESLQ